jgi:hypothetical protein
MEYFNFINSFSVSFAFEIFARSLTSGRLIEQGTPMT